MVRYVDFKYGFDERGTKSSIADILSFEEKSLTIWKSLPQLPPRGQLAHWFYLYSVKPNKLYNIKNSLSPVNIFPNKALENAVLPFQT